MPRPQPQPSEPDIDTNIASPEMAPDDGITGQQQKQSSRPKKPHKKNGHVRRQVEDPPAAVTTKGQPPTMTPASPSPRLVTASGDPNPQPTATNPQDPPKKKRCRNHSRKSRRARKMTELPASAYVPPHLRPPKGSKGKAAVEVSSPSGQPGTTGEPSTNKACETSPANGTTEIPKLPTEKATEKNATSCVASDQLNFVVRAVQDKLSSARKSSMKQPAAPLSPPDTSPESEEVEQGDANVWVPENIPQTGPRFQNPRSQNPRWQNQNGPRQPYKRTPWPKNRDMKALPSESDSDDGGVVFRSNSHDDPDYDIKQLVDWNGDWLPPPEEWAARNPFVNRNFGQWVERWINGHAPDCTKALDISAQAFTGEGEHGEHKEAHKNCKELVPQYWMAVQVEGKPLGEFWKEMPSRAPETFSDIDLAAETPWWERYEIGQKSFLANLTVPDARIDINDIENRFNRYGFASANNLIAEKKARHDRQVQESMARRARPPPEPKVKVTPVVVDDRLIRPSTNLYLRPVQDTDVRGIAEIYNYYVENGIYAHEFDLRTEAQIKSRVDEVVQAGLPYLVAVARGNYPRREGEKEKILGWICLDDYCDPASMYRYTFDVELIVHPGFTQKKIAKCLLDCLLEMSNTGYKVRGGYDYVNESEYLKQGPTRVIKTMLLHFHHKHGEDIDWANEFMRDFNFHRAGRFSHIGYKQGNVVDMTAYQHNTTENINAAGIPAARL
ncbi:hypothetical protein IQ07DRAFT_674610 [Pyrenochaeta sp. DS3sAY3a]|nr:hypothetical protein IQ07DRAFT_674610 [Pyrenochaeta sp. DS3sAY3a]